MRDEKIIDIIKSIGIFGDFSTKTEKLILSCERRRYESGENVENNESRMLGAVLAGRFEITSAEGGRALINTVCAGGVFGAATVFLGGNDISRIVAKTKGEVLFIPRETLEKIISSGAEVGFAYAAFLSKKIYLLNKKIISLSSPRADAALAGFIADNASSGELKPNMSHIARRLGVGRTTLYNAVRTLEGDGILSYENGKIKIKDADMLASRRKNI